MRMFLLFGRKKKYSSLSWWENFMGGYVNMGNITIYGANAMRWVVNIRTKRWGYICFTLPTVDRITGKDRWYFYLSPNATPWACTFYRGSDKSERIRAQIRKMNFGHNFRASDQAIYKKLRCLNDKFEWFNICEYDLAKFENRSIGIDISH